MAVGNIFAIPKKMTIAKSLAGKHIVFAGHPKVGKSQTASQAPRTIFLATESGQEFLTDITVVPIGSWADFKQAVTQLASPEGRQNFDTVVIDSQTNLVMYLDKFVGGKLSTEKDTLDWGSDADYGKGNKTSKNELGFQIQRLLNIGFLVISIIHTEDKVNFNTQKEYIGTSLSPALWGLVEKSADQTIYLCRQRANKSAPLEYVSYFDDKGGFMSTGGRLSPKTSSVPTSWANIEKALLDAIDPNVATETYVKPATIIEATPAKSFVELKAEFDTLTKELMASDESNGAVIIEIVEAELGAGKKVSTMRSNQIEQLELIITNLRAKLDTKKENE